MKKLLFLLLGLVLLTACGAAQEPVRTKNCFTVGYAAEAIPLDEAHPERYYVAGYRNGLPAVGILDRQTVRAAVLDDNSGLGPVALVSVDCVALSSAETAKIRSALREFTEQTGCRAIHVTATHDHAGADTLGLWGPEGIDGKDDAFLTALRETAVRCVRAAYDARTDGNLYFGFADTSDARIQEDTRKPECFDPNLYCFRFVPYDTSRAPVRLLNYAVHAESLDGSNALLSADLPGAVAEMLQNADGSGMLWFPGAIGGLLRTRFTEDDRVENCRVTAERIAEAALSIRNEVRLEPELACRTVQFSVPCDNPLFVGMKFLGVLDQNAHTAGGRLWLDTELSLLSVGGKQILLLPGEIFPELVYGCETEIFDAFPEEKLPTLCSVLGDDLLIFGLTDDEIGYIVAPENFRLAETHPYLDTEKDRFGENHYEETNSTGPEAARFVYEAALLLLN